MKLGWNQLCPCGSGLKFKKCCRVASVVKENADLVVPASIVDILMMLKTIVNVLDQAISSDALKGPAADGRPLPAVGFSDPQRKISPSLHT